MKLVFPASKSVHLRIVAGLGIALAIPGAAQARTLADIIQRFIDLIEYTIPLLMGMALLVFMWGGAKFMYGAGDEKTRNAGKALLLWGVVGLFVMVSVWGIVIIVSTTFFG